MAIDSRVLDHSIEFIDGVPFIKGDLSSPYHSVLKEELVGMSQLSKNLTEAEDLCGHLKFLLADLSSIISVKK